MDPRREYSNDPFMGCDLNLLNSSFITYFDKNTTIKSLKNTYSTHEALL